MRIIPPVIAVVYGCVLGVCLLRRIIWPSGDAEDVFEPALLAVPWGLMTVLYPGGKTGAFVVAAVGIVLNAISLHFLLRFFLRSLRPEKDSLTLK